MDKMKAIGFYRSLPIDHPESLMDLEIEKPTVAKRDVLVKVNAIPVNPIDIKIRKSKESTEKQPHILGWDVAGMVEQVGSECTLFQPGDEVYYAGSMTRLGGNSEYHVVDERIVGKKPTRLDFSQAAALPLTGITAWEGLFERLDISQIPHDNQNRTILIIGAAGGVGSIATQLARLVGLTVIGTASRPQSVKWVKQHGANEVINHFADFVPQLQSIKINSVDYIFCLSHTDQHWHQMAESIAPQGKICSIVDAKKELNLDLLKKKSATFVWEFMFTRSMYQTLDMEKQGQILNKLSEWVDAGLIQTTVTRCLEPIHAENLRIAHAEVETGKTIGKITLYNFASERTMR